MTVVCYGSVYVEAETQEEAMRIADHQLTDTVEWTEDWRPIAANECDTDEEAPGFISEPAW